MAPVITQPPESLVFGSLSELYEHFRELFIGKDFVCPRGIPLSITSHHFFHLVKLQRSGQTEFSINVEEDLINQTTEGFGEYSVDMDRAMRLSWIPEILTEPHEI